MFQPEYLTGADILPFFLARGVANPGDFNRFPDTIQEQVAGL
jgi:hypothetical protein